MRHFFAFLLIFAALSLPAQAETYTQSIDQLSKLHSTKVAQNPNYTHIENILAYDILDRKKRVIGTLKSILINPNGTVNALTVQFDRLRLNQDVTLDFETSGIAPDAGAYIFENYDKEQVAELYPAFLAEIQSAAGENEIISASSLIDKTVKKPDGRVLGKITDVIFDDRGTQVKALKLTMTNRNELEIPFQLFARSGSDLELSDDEFRAVEDFMKIR